MENDARVDRLFDNTAEAMGGKYAWRRTRYLRFELAIVKDGGEISRTRHWWDRPTGRCRSAWKDRDGKSIEAWFPLSDPRSGSARRAGQPLFDEAAESNYPRDYK